MRKKETAETRREAKPFLKWAGGKTQLLELLESFLPEAVTSGVTRYYYEPFLGGGALLLLILQKYSHIRRVYAYDKNIDLIHVYEMIKTKPAELIHVLEAAERTYRSFSPEAQKKMFYEERDAFNAADISESGTVERAAQFIFLNKTCYNGLFRLNKKGKFNVPFGRYKNPGFYDAENIMAVSTLLQRVELRAASYESFLDDLNPNSFVYFDPPYMPASKTAQFTAYTSDGFGEKDQHELARLFVELSRRSDVKLMLSNAETNNDYYEEVFTGTGIVTHTVEAKRSINSKASQRGVVRELLVTSY